MRNLLVLQDIIHALPLPLHKNDSETSSRIVSYACDYGISTLLLLTSDGYLFSYSFTADGAGEERSGKCPFWLTRDEPWKLNIDPNNPNDQGWFYVSIVAETGTIVCISHSGSIVSIKENIGYESWSDIVEQEGDVDGGIATAQWCPDQTSLILVTKNNTILSMTTSWDVLQEIPLESFLPDTSCSISWRSDGDFFSLTTTDNDNITSARVFNKDLELHATGRNLGDGSAAVLKSLGSPIAFGANGSLIAVTQAIKNKHQVSFLEKNGLRHGEFEIKCPPIPNGWDAWKVSSLHWDLPSTLLAVGLKAISNTDNTGDNSPGLVQIYYRNNYHWYLKQQWSGIALSCIRFDNELSGRVYLSQITSIESYRFPVIRIIDTTWDMYSSNTVDCTAAVIDGSDLLLTPLGNAMVPPPMYKYKLTLPAPCVYASFWNPIDEIANNIVIKDENKKVWGMACLCDGNIICLNFGNYLGKTIGQYNINIVDVIDTFQLGNNVNSFFSCRSIIVSELSEGILAICIVRSRMIIEGFNDELYEDESLTNDELIILHYEISISKVIKAELRTNITGTITRLITWPKDPNSIGMGININAESFEVLRIDLNIDDSNDFGNITTDIKNIHESTVNFPELITHLGVVSNNSSDEVALIGISNKNRLFCGDILLIVGASSFSINEPLGIFLYATIGTRPCLHFMATSSLLALDQVLGQEQALCDLAEPRPLERGARITACINGSSKVIIQLPRGNLEAFEPRPLILLRARQLLNENKFLECLILLRRQKVDLNYVVDYNPKLFMANIDELVKGSVGINSEILSLLLSSLSPTDTSIFKYRNPNRDIIDEVSNLFTSENKVNFICSAIRDSLVPLLKDGNHDALYPTLCTYAHQKPPLLVDAFVCIRMSCSNKLDNTTSLSSTKVQSAIKYLAFLADGKLLFDAAVGSCDYEMAKAVARQSQMDPKIYLPLLESFEYIGRGFDIDSRQYYMMNYTVNNHLNKYEEMIAFASKVLYSYYMEIKQQNSINLDGKLSNEISEMCDNVLNITSLNNLYSHTIPIFTRIALSSNKKKQSNDDNILYKFLSKLKLSHGNFCILKMDYKEAIVAFMTAVPPHASDAIRACRLESNWEYALIIAGRYSNLLGCDNSQQSLAQDIVAEYRENLEFNNENYDEENYDNSSNNISEMGSTFDNSGDKGIEAAQLCLDYCNDAESAVSILILSQKWLEAAGASMKKNRNDLLHDEVIFIYL
jgi:elongator complex protein 1